MPEKHSTITPDILRRWERYMSKINISPELYKSSVRIIKDESGTSDYTFGAVLNGYRFQRFNSSNEKDECVLCDAVISVKTVWERNLFPEYFLPGFVVVPNNFPLTRGASMAVANSVRDKERGMYKTDNINVGRLTHEISNLLNFSDVSGLQIFHNSEGFGASIPRHEHWHLTDFGNLYDIAGNTYGFDAADKIKTSKGVMKMPYFPFSHLIFDRNDPEKLVYFLNNLKKIGGDFEKRHTPHTISQGKEGLLVTVSKNYVEKESIWSGDVAGHIFFKSREKFEEANFRTCISRLSETLFNRNELNLESLL